MVRTPSSSQFEEILPETDLFRRILHVTVAERPIFAAGIDEADPNIFLSHTRPVVDFVGNLTEEALLCLDGSSTDPRDLNDDEVGGVLHAQVSLFGINDLVGLVSGDDL